MLKFIFVLAVAAVAGCSSSGGGGGTPAVEPSTDIIDVETPIEGEPTARQRMKDICYVGGSLVALGYEEYQNIHNDIIIHNDGNFVERLELLFERRTGRIDVPHEILLELVEEGYSFMSPPWSDVVLTYNDVFYSYYYPCMDGER